MKFINEKYYNLDLLLLDKHFVLQWINIFFWGGSVLLANPIGMNEVDAVGGNSDQNILIL